MIMQSRTGVFRIPPRRKALVAVGAALAVLAVSAVQPAAAGQAAAGQASSGQASSGPVIGSSDDVLVPIGDGVATIDIRDLETVYRANGTTIPWSAPSPTDLGSPTRPTVVDDRVHWGYASGLTVSVGEADGRLDLRFSSETDRELTWPVTPTGKDPSNPADLTPASIEFANGEGRSIPTGDAFWLSDDAELIGSSWDFAGGLTVPAWGTSFPAGGVSYLMHDDIGSTLSFDRTDDLVRASADHAFSAGRGTQSYHLAIAPTDGNPVASAQDYRRYLDAIGGVTTLDEKIAADPAVAKLLGAFHAYTWGSGQTPELVDRLTELGLTKAWLGYDGDAIGPEAVTAAKDAGLLVGPYDTWANVQDPNTADTPLAIWPGLWPDGCVTDADGKPVTGFGGRGCYLSSAALAEADANHGLISDRVHQLIENGSNTYFLDVDAVGELFQDFSPGHPMTEAEDRGLRLDRLERLVSGGFSDGVPLVVGSESAGAWANSGVAFSHGSSTSIANGLWAFERDKEQWGGYTPANRPDNFFMPVELPEHLAKAMFDPRYRVPLYSTVLHDSVVTTDRWELGLYKFPALVRDRVLSSMLTNTPLILALDAQVLTEHGDELATFQRFFGTLQDAAGTKPLTSFERLGEDVQRTVFGDGALTLTANFGTTDSSAAPAGCIVAEIPGQSTTELCPAG